MTNRPALRMRASLALILVFALVPIPSFGWGPEGHLMTNQIAAAHVPADMPKFFRDAGARLGYLASEPDRWRDKRDAQLKAAQEPEHFIDLERVDWMRELPSNRWLFVRALYEKRATATNPDELLPERVGLVPYETVEVYQRLREAFRQYRQLASEHKPTEAAEQDAVFYAGWLGHYVGDSGQPLHTTVHYDGWVGPNPNGYAVHVGIPPGAEYAPGLHWKFESIFVAANLKPEDVAALMQPVKPLKDVFAEYMKFLRESHSLVEKLYQLDKAKAFDGAGTAEGKRFVAERLAAGTQMLVDMWYTAWLESAEVAPKPEATPPPKGEKK